MSAPFSFSVCGGRTGAEDEAGCEVGVGGFAREASARPPSRAADASLSLSSAFDLDDVCRAWQAWHGRHDRRVGIFILVLNYQGGALYTTSANGQQ